MAEKRKGKRRKEDPYGGRDEDVDKPSKEEYAVAKWLKKNVPNKRTKFLYHNVEYFTGVKAVDALMDSYWGKPKKEGEEAFFATRYDVVEFLDAMLRHKFFHRAKKVPVSEQELLARKKKKKEKESGDKKETEDAESSHAEGKGYAKEGTVKKTKKIRLEMHLEQIFADTLDAYVWIYDPIPFHYWLFGTLLVLGAIAVCLFPLWPPEVRKGVYYLSIAAAGFLCFIIALAVVRVIVFCLLWALTFGKHHLWLFPNLTEDVGFFASFWPLYQYEYKGEDGGKGDVKKKKKEKDSDNEQDDDTRDEELDENTNDERSQETDGQKTNGDRNSDAERNSPSESESESSSQKSQTGKDFEMVDKDEVDEVVDADMGGKS